MVEAILDKNINFYNIGDLIYLLADEDDNLVREIKYWRRVEIIKKEGNIICVHLLGWSSLWNKEINIVEDKDKYKLFDYEIHKQGGLILPDGRTERLEFIREKIRMNTELLKIGYEITSLKNAKNDLIFELEQQKLYNYKLRIIDQERELKLCRLREQNSMSTHLAQIIYPKLKECPICLHEIDFDKWCLNICGHQMCKKCSLEIDKCSICRRRKNLYIFG